MPLSDKRRVECLMPFALVKRMVEVLYLEEDPDYDESRELLAKLSTVYVEVTADMTDANRRSLLRRLDRLVNDLAKTFKGQNMVAVMGMLTAWLNEMAEEGALTIDYDAPAGKVFTYLLDFANRMIENSEQMERPDTTARIIVNSVGIGPLLLPTFKQRLAAQGLYQ